MSSCFLIIVSNTTLYPTKEKTIWFLFILFFFKFCFFKKQILSSLNIPSIYSHTICNFFPHSQPKHVSQIKGISYEGSESPILRNSPLFRAIRNLFRATPNMFPFILHLVCNTCKHNFSSPDLVLEFEDTFTCAIETQHETSQPTVRVDGGVLLS